MLDLDEARLEQRVNTVIGGEPDRVFDVYRKAHPESSPWDLYMLIGTNHPRGTYTRELARRKADLVQRFGESRRSSFCFFASGGGMPARFEDRRV